MLHDVIHKFRKQTNQQRVPQNALTEKKKKKSFTIY